MGTHKSVQYAKSISIDPDSGDISLIDPTTLTCKSSSSSSVTNFCSTLCELAPVYILATEELGDQHIFYIPDGATYTDSTWIGTAAYTIVGKHNSSTGVTYVRLSTGAPEALIASLVTSEIVNVPAGATTYVHSSDRNAYPDSGTVGDLTYQYLGIPLDNAVTVPKIAIGSYVGTGKVGPSYPNSLTFDKQPVMVLLLGYLESGKYYPCFGNGSTTIMYVMSPPVMNTTAISGVGFGHNSDGYIWGKKSADGKTLSWYRADSRGAEISNDRAYRQSNDSGQTYYYAAFFD